MSEPQNPLCFKRGRVQTVQFSVTNPGTFLKSLAFRVNNTKLRDMAIDAILKSIVDTRMRCPHKFAPHVFISRLLTGAFNFD